MPQVAKGLILGIDFLKMFGFQLTLPNETSPVLKQVSTKSQINMFELCFVEDYFALSDEKVCFQLNPDPCVSVKDQANENDAHY